MGRPGSLLQPPVAEEHRPVKVRCDPIERRARLIKAIRALASARLLLDAGDTDGTCNRAYYAMFDAARAALAGEDTPETTRTHSGLIAAFGLQLVKPGRLPRGPSDGC